MKRALGLFALSALCSAGPALAQPKPPKLLLQLVHCADLSNATVNKNGMVKVRFTHYVQSEPDLEGFVLIAYDSPSKGEVLDYVREFDHGKVRLYLVNNASFSVSPEGVLSVVDALGGVWTQGHLKQRAKRAMRNTKYFIPAESVAGPFQDVSCHAPWDR